MKIDSQSKLTSEVFKVTYNHFRSGGRVTSLASKLNVSRKTIYHWKKKYPDYEMCIEVAQGELIGFYEKVVNAKAIGLNLSDEIPNFDQIDGMKAFKELKKLCPEEYNPRSSKYKKAKL